MENKESRIALFMLPLLTQGGGAEKYFVELARNLRESGFEADIVTMDERFFARFARFLHIFTRGNFFGKIDIGGRESEGAIQKQLGAAQWIKASRKNLGAVLRNYDIVYSKNEVVDLALLKFTGYKKLPPVIVGVHTPIYFPNAKSFLTKLHNFLYLGFLYKWLLREVKCVHVSNIFTKNLVDEKFKMKCKLIYYPFSVENIRESAENNKSDINFDANKINIIFTGRLSEQKGFDALVSLIEKISEDNDLKSKISLNIFGSGGLDENRKIKKLSEKFDFARYFGHIENKFMPDILAHQDLMIAPSRWETLPYNILEAQALGLPVVAFDIPGPADIVENEKTGFLVKNEEEFFERINRIVSGKVSFDKEYIIQNIRKKFDPEKIHKEIIEMFQECI